MTKEEVIAQLKANKEKMQNEFIDKLLDQVNYLNEKANQKGYEPTDHERETFGLIVRIIDNMNNWF